MAKRNQLRFHIYTFIGSWPWCYVLAYIILIGIVLYVWTHWKNRIRVEAA